ncbi:MAG: hypothetical protein DKT66_09245 [Candidatus Melainabacteria bacterium]|nr:MAG: hypothetical protein DKT66_09245 [Candidatus Melainabacteria bacterium]
MTSQKHSLSRKIVEIIAGSYEPDTQCPPRYFPISALIIAFREQCTTKTHEAKQELRRPGSKMRVKRKPHENRKADSTLSYSIFLKRKKNRVSA